MCVPACMCAVTSFPCMEEWSMNHISGGILSPRGILVPVNHTRTDNQSRDMACICHCQKF